MWRAARQATASFFFSAARSPAVRQLATEQARNPQWWMRATAAATTGFAIAAAGQAAFAEEDDTQEEIVSYTGQKKKQSIPSSWSKFTIIDIEDISRDVRIYRFALKDPRSEFYLGTTCTLQVAFWDWDVDTNPDVYRHYTPITPPGNVGYFDLMIKHYPGGFITEKMWKLKVGDKVKMRRQGTKLKYVPNKWKQINMIAGGVGVTPLLQIVRTVLMNPDDHTKLKLLFCCRTIEDILLHHEMKTLQALHPDRFECIYMIGNKQGLEFDSYEGRADYNTLKKIFGSPSKGELMTLCGPDGMATDLAGVARAHQIFWSHTYDGSTAGGPDRKAVRQPSIMDANNMGPVGGALGALGWSRDNMYTF